MAKIDPTHRGESLQLMAPSARSRAPLRLFRPSSETPSSCGANEPRSEGLLLGDYAASGVPRAVAKRAAEQERSRREAEEKAAAERAVEQAQLQKEVEVKTAAERAAEQTQLQRQ